VGLRERFLAGAKNSSTTASELGNFGRRRFGLQHLLKDALAGLVGATVVLPQGIAFAAIAGLPPEYGLFSAMVPTIIAAVFGSSTIMVSGPTTAISVVVFSVLSESYESGTAEFVQMAILLSLMVGLIQILFSAFKAGRLAKFVSHSVMIGFTIAAALLIISSQLGAALGIKTSSGGTVVDRIWFACLEITTLDFNTSLVAGVTFFAAVFFGCFVPRLPGFLIALAIGTLVSTIFTWQGIGFETVGVIGTIAPSFQPPSIGLDQVESLSKGALTIALIGLLEALAIGRAFSNKTNSPFSANKEAFGQGLSNFVGSFFQAYPTSGSFTRTGVNYVSGGQTFVAAIFSAIFLLPLLIFFAPLFAIVPKSALAGLILYVAVRLIDLEEVKSIAKRGKTDILTIIVTGVSGMVLHLETALLIGVAFSVSAFLLRTSKTRLRIEAPDSLQVGREFRDVEDFGQPECPQVLFVRVDGPLYFGTAENLQRELAKLAFDRPKQKRLVINLKGTGDIDAEGVGSIISAIRHRKLSGGRTYIVARSLTMVTRIEKLGLAEVLVDGDIFENKNHAIRAITPFLDTSICATCDARIFRECKTICEPPTVQID